MEERLAPIAVFAFNRPEHLSRCLEALRSNPEAESSALYIFCDGPQYADQVTAIQRVRDIARSSEGFQSVVVVEREVNQGLSRNIIDGVGEVLRLHETVVVVEDDLLVADSFLAFMNAGLEVYAEQPRVASIHGFVYEVGQPLPQSFFLKGADCWGWATWRRAWEHFEPDGLLLLERLDATGSAEDFDFAGAFPYRQMLIDQIRGSIDSWAVRWYASAYLADMLTLYPGTSLVRNLGLDGSGTHQGSRPAMEATLGNFLPPLQRVAVEESAEARRAIAIALSREHGSPMRSLKRIWQAIRS